jgi:hypothetical protein
MARCDTQNIGLYSGSCPIGQVSKVQLRTLAIYQARLSQQTERSVKVKGLQDTSTIA